MSSAAATRAADRARISDLFLIEAEILTQFAHLEPKKARSATSGLPSLELAK
jgi:hypothetical protein